MKLRKLSPGETELLVAVLKDIKSELNRCYWNKNQKEMRSPFDNTGESYSNDTFVVNAYYWGDDERLSDRPNFRYKDLKVYWYKYLGRATVATIEGSFTLSFLKYMLVDCKDAIRRDYEKKRTD
jgi:hypothetical protein